MSGKENSRPASRARKDADGAVFINGGDTAADVNRIATAYHLYTEEDLGKKLVYVEASRGCVYGCEFCCGSSGRGGRQPVREFPLEPFLEDMDMLIKKGGRQFKFLDRSFNLNTERAGRIMEFFLERINAPGFSAGDKTRKERLCVHFEMVPSRFPPELRELIRRFPPGSLRLELGIQTFNPETAALVHRRSDPAAETETLEFLHRETNAVVHADLIAGLPGEDLSSFGRGFDRLWQALTTAARETPFEIQPGTLKCLPGTPIARHNEAFGMRYSGEPPYELIESGSLCAEEFGKIKNFARFWETIVNRNPFPDLLPRLLPPGKPVFGKFMFLSEKLLGKFGRNWGIGREELRLFLETYKDEL